MKVLTKQEFALKGGQYEKENAYPCHSNSHNRFGGSSMVLRITQPEKQRQLTEPYFYRPSGRSRGK
jgi:hypothetical protein